jgi:hypothetical protein
MGSAICRGSKRSERFVAVLERFLEETDPAQFDAEQWRARFHLTPDGP